SQKLKKKIMKSSNINANDVDYIPAMGEDNDVNQDMDDMTFVENENEVQTDDSDDELGNEDDILIQERLQEILESKKRGPTMLHVVHTSKVDDREIIICNEFGQPVGPVTNEIVGRFSRFLGTIARNHSYVPLIHSSWHKVPHKDKIWEYVLEKYDVPDAAKKWVLLTIGHSYKEQMKNYKSSENESASVDPFMIVMNKENNGYCRLYGRGVTNRLIKKINGGDTTNMFPEGIMESFNASFEGQKHELLEMRKELDEEHERKRTELEAIQLDIKNQQEHLEATMRKLMEQLPLKDLSIEYKLHVFTTLYECN
ncbi:hypothetical protein R6Q59_018811, partial [Mikania micrantha]